MKAQSALHEEILIMLCLPEPQSARLGHLQITVALSIKIYLSYVIKEIFEF